MSRANASGPKSRDLEGTAAPTFIGVAFKINPTGGKASHLVGISETSADSASLVALTVKNPPAMRKAWIRSLGWEDPREKGMATHSSLLAWIVPWTEEAGCLQSMGSQSRTRLSTAQCRRSVSSEGFLSSVFHWITRVLFNVQTPEVWADLLNFGESAKGASLTECPDESDVP